MTDLNQPPAAPTPDDARAIFDRATQAAQRAETAAQRLEAAGTAAGHETRQRFPDMPEEVVRQISDATAKATVDAMNAQFELQQQQAQAAQQNPPADDKPAGEQPPAEPPRKRSFADWVLGQ